MMRGKLIQIGMTAVASAPLGIRVCIVRKKDGNRHGDWQCSPSTGS